ncbi:hypothetical protein MJO28_016393 [Puccinia striiformis f. sp. tritici]|uniref:Uncharacterized protein n=1 Tax=Puccinia striiformis f. sp. tritici TaxID=168172 RepID=A0ACC0DN88_9BASI|nr:hypothetical protein MJO28_016393 [Puccinia striiformis f. sp. tritici]
MTAPTTAPPITWTSELSLPVASQERAIRTQELVWSSSIQPPLHSKHPKCNLHQPRLRFQNTFKKDTECSLQTSPPFSYG